MIELASKSLLDDIIRDIQATPFLIILDTTQDMSKMDHILVVIRHVSVEDTIKISESFLGFTSLYFFIRNYLDIKKSRGQGAAVISGIYGRVEAIIKDLSANAEYVHCASHNLNMVLNDAVNDFSVLSNIYV